MLTPEQAQETLKAHAVRSIDTYYVDSIKALPAALHATAFAFIRRDPEGKVIHSYNNADQKRREALDERLNQIESMSADDRLKIFTIFFPKFAPHIETTWHFLKTQPYQGGWSRAAYRAPNNPYTTLAKRKSWLSTLISRIGVYQEDLIWFAQHSPYIDYGWAAQEMSPIFAAVIDAGGKVGEEVYEILKASGRGDHPVGAMGRHVPRSLLMASRPDGWEFVERMLLAAQREEGLRQVILESVDEAHPTAFRRMLRVVLDNDLARFSAVTRAANVWFGFNHDSENVRSVNRAIEQTMTYLDNSAARDEALVNGNGEAVYLALWALAFGDVFLAIPQAANLLTDANLERRFAAAHLLANLHLPAASKALIPMLRDPDLKVAARAVGAMIPDQMNGMGLFEEIEALLPRLPKDDTMLGPIIWDWLWVGASQTRTADMLLTTLEDRSPKRLIPHLSTFTQYSRNTAAEKLATLGLDDLEVRDALLMMVRDRSSWVTEHILKLIGKYPITGETAVQLEALLTRKAANTRRAVLSKLASQKPDAAFASADRLIAAKKPEQRSAGLELLNLIVKRNRNQESAPETRVLAETRALAYREARPDAPEAEQNQLRLLLDPQDEKPITLDDALGLMNPAERTKPTMPKKRKAELLTPATKRCLQALDALIHENRTLPLVLKTWQGEQDFLLGDANAARAFPSVDHDSTADMLPLRDVWETWYQARPDNQRDADGLELLRGWLDMSPRGYFSNPDDEKPERIPLKYPEMVQSVVVWLMKLHPPQHGADFLLDALEDQYANLPQKLLKRDKKEDSDDDSYGYGDDWRGGWSSPFTHRLNCTRIHRDLIGSWKDKQHARLWMILRWLDEPHPGYSRMRPTLDELMRGYQSGAATVADIYDQMLGAGRSYNGFYELGQLSSKTPSKLFEKYPILREVFENCRQRVLEVELRRGEMPTPATEAVRSLRSVYGVDWFVRVLGTLGKENFVRGYVYSGWSKPVTFSHLLRVSFPAENETPELFAEKVKAARLSEKRLIEAAVYAPQWARYVEAALKWEGLADAIWWLHAHTKDSQWRVDREIRESWQAETGELTPLTAEDLTQGGVDVAWFWRTHKTLGAERWKKVYDAARYSSGGTGHNRAKLFADAMLGELDQPTLVERINQKRNQDAVRALGLLSIPKKNRDNVILERYRIIQEFLRTSRKFGGQRRDSEGLAARIGLENLARSAGYPDPGRLQWAMEAEESADLRAGAISVTVEDVTLVLSIDPLGKADLSVSRAGKKLKALPAKFKKTPEVIEIRARKDALTKQYSRMRLSLENAMCRADTFSVKEIVNLMAHPVLAPMLEALIFLVEGETGVMGYPEQAEKGVNLFAHDGTITLLPADAMLRLAHPYDLYQTGEWHLWQRDVFVTERVQPFKQVFRELYTLTDAEKRDGAMSRRYAGHQVQPRKTVALLNGRGWVARPEEGIQKTFHGQKLSAFLTFQGGYFTPAEVEGLTLEGVIFIEPGVWKPLPLEDLPPLLFSEVMRDLDLVVSVAHRGGIDPEATASTVEMRASLIRETMGLLKVTNVTLERSHALIEGKIGNYSVHLGSGIVHRQPGGSLCIIPVHAQHRGRLFLPFADDDPRTAEVLSKVLLLSNDAQIKDPSILEQIIAR